MDEMQHLLFNHNVSLTQCPELTLSHQRNFIEHIIYTTMLGYILKEC